MKYLGHLPATARGAVYMLLSTVCLAVLWVLIRYASHTMPSPLIVFYRTFFGLLFMAPILLRERHHVFVTHRLGLHILRSLTGIIAMYATFYAVAVAPLADIVAISYATPLFATLVAVLALGEVIRARRITTLLIGLFGMLLVMRPGLRELGPGHLAALGAALMTAGSLTAIKLLSATERIDAIVGFTYIFMLPINFIVALFFWQWPNMTELVLLVGIGILANLGQVFLARSFAAAEITAVLPLDFVRLVLAAGFGIVLFGEHLDWQTLLGASVILLSSVYLAHRESRLAKIAAAKGEVMTEKRQRPNLHE